MLDNVRIGEYNIYINHMEIYIMDYLTAKEIGEKWGISDRRVIVLCDKGRIKGATRLGKAWAIPKDAEKPKDARIKTGEYIGFREKNLDKQ